MWQSMHIIWTGLMIHPALFDHGEFEKLFLAVFHSYIADGSTELVCGLSDILFKDLILIILVFYYVNIMPFHQLIRC